MTSRFSRTAATSRRLLFGCHGLSTWGLVLTASAKFLKEMSEGPQSQKSRKRTHRNTNRRKDSELITKLFGDDTTKKRKFHDSRDSKLTSSRNPAKRFLFGETVRMVGFGSQKEPESAKNVRNCPNRTRGLGPGSIGLDVQKFCYNPLWPKEVHRNFYNETL